MRDIFPPFRVHRAGGQRSSSSETSFGAVFVNDHIGYAESIYIYIYIQWRLDRIWDTHIHTSKVKHIVLESKIKSQIYKLVWQWIGCCNDCIRTIDKLYVERSRWVSARLMGINQPAFTDILYMYTRLYRHSVRGVCRDPRIYRDNMEIHYKLADTPIDLSINSLRTQVTAFIIYTKKFPTVTRVAIYN